MKDPALCITFFVMYSVVHVFGNAQPNNTYFITAPSVFRPGRPLKLHIMLSNAVTNPVNIVATIVDRNHFPMPRDDQVVARGSGTFTNGPAAELTLQIPHGVAVSSASYVLQVLGTGALDINQTKYIEFREKALSIYIQTDKAIYKPGQKILMRIFGVHPDLKLYTGNVTVDILDPDKNKMAHWVNLSSKSGVIKREFLLSTDPVEGDWKISVTSEDQTAEQVIEVKPYVLPKFEVKVELPPYVLEKERKVHGTVDVKYTYGKGAQGRANVKAFFNYYWWKKDIAALSKDIRVNASGQGSFSFDMKYILQLFKESFTYIRDTKNLFQYGYRLDVNVTFHEDLTGKIATAQGSVSFHQMDVKLKFAEFNPSYYKPGLPFQALLQVLQPNGEQLSVEKLTMMRSKIKVKTRYTWRGDGDGEVEFVSPGRDGTVLITRNVPSSAQKLNLEVEYSELSQDSVSAYFYASKSYSPSDSYIQLSTTTPSVKAGDNIACEVQSTYILSELKYMILARGIAVKTDTYIPASGSTKLSFSIPSTAAMAPTCRLVVYSMKQGGEIVVDALNIKVENPFQNNVSLTIDTNNRASVAPGDMVTFKARASADSLVALRAVDKSVLLMKEDTDISVSKVLEELQSFDSARLWYPLWEWDFRRNRRFIMPYPTSGRDANSIFSNSGVLVFTNYDLPGGWDNRLLKKFSAVDSDVRFEVAESVPDSAGGAAPTLAEVKRVRTLFPETWIWMERNASASGDVEFQQAVPDTLTTWVASAFAVSPSDGLGVGEIKPQVQVFQSFFVSMNLPYSVVRGEEVALQVTVFNYEKNAQQVTITLKGSKDWAVIDETNALGLRGKSDKFANEAYVETDVDQKVELLVGAGQGRAVSFPVVPQTLGQVPIEVRAQSTSKADAVRRNLLVEPEGIPQEYSFSLLLNFSSPSSLSRQLLLDLPDDTVTGSARATVSVMGDILGSSISNLDHLVRMPYGCGEQNMVNFAPNIYVMKYLTAVNQLSQGIENKAKTYMISGYQREQRYRHNDGSYSAFGGRDTSGSMWLTAFVAKSFAQARAFIPEYIDNELLEASLQWIARKANRDGSFPKVGHVSSYLKGGQDGVITLTAYVLIALAEANSQDPVVVNAKSKAQAFLEGEVEKMTRFNTDSYTLAIVTYALSVVDSNKRFSPLNELEAAAVKRDGLTYWKEKKGDDNDSPWENPYYRPRSADIEITAYALMALSSARDLNDLLPIGRWLSQQRSSLGGYSSTQDTVIGLQALSEFAAGIYSSDIDFSVQLTSSVDPSFAKTITVNQQTAMVLQQVELLKVGGSLSITGSGRGVGMLQVGVTYNVEKEPGERSFGFDLEVEEETDYMVKLKACSKWAEKEGKSGMAVMDLGIPSGFELDSESVEDSLSNPSLQLKRVEPADRKVLLYFDEIPSEDSVCVSVIFVRAYNVGKPQPSTAVVYDYYNPENRATSLYIVGSLKDKGVCSVCSDCVNCSPQEATELPQSLAPGHSATVGSGALALLLLAVLLQ